MASKFPLDPPESSWQQPQVGWQRWLGPLKIAQKISLGYALALSIAIVGTTAGFVVGDYYRNQGSLMEKDAQEELSLLSELRLCTLTLEKYQHQLVTFIDDPKLVQEEASHILQHIAELRQHWQEFQISEGATKSQQGRDPTLDPNSEVDAVQQFLRTYGDVPDTYLLRFEQLVQQLNLKALTPEQVETARTRLAAFNRTSISEQIEDFSDGLDNLNLRTIQELAQARAVSEAAHSLEVSIVLVSMALSVMIATLAAIYSSRMITVPLVSVAKIAEQVTQEDNFELRVPVQTADEIGTVAHSLNQLVQRVQYLLNEQAQNQQALERYSQNLEQQVEERTQALSQALEHLQTTQVELIQSEKLAAIGHLVAGIAHEINTPLGVIQASIDNISGSLSSCVKTLFHLFQILSPQQLESFFTLLDKIQESSSHLSSREERALKRLLLQTLQNYPVPNSMRVADIFSRMAIAPDGLAPFWPVLQVPNNLEILEMVHHFSVIQSNNQNIRLAVERAAKIVFALKNYARQDNFNERVFVEITEGIDTVLTLYQNQTKRGIEVRKNYGVIPKIHCYAEELIQVWSNLISNAIQAMKCQGLLEITVAEQDGQIVVEIMDTGCGIPEEIQHRIFDPFFTTKPAGEGSGLGLDIVKKIVDRHQGKITVASQPKQTTFRVCLPVA